MNTRIAFRTLLALWFVAIVSAQTRLYSPGSLIFEEPLSGHTDSQAIVLSTSSEFTAALAGNCGSWLGLGSTRAFGALRVDVFPISSTAGVYTCGITLSQNGGVVGTIPVTMRLGIDGIASTQSALVAPNQIYRSGTATVNAPSPISVGATCIGSQISVCGLNGTLGADNSLTASSSGDGLVYVETPLGTDLVRVLSTSSQFAASPRLNFTYTAGGTPFSAAFNVSNATNPSGVLPITVTPAVNWIRVLTPQPQSTPAAHVDLTIDPSGLPNGLNTGAVMVRTTSQTSTDRVGFLVVPVVVMVSGSAVPGNAPGPATDTLLFSGPANGGDAPSQMLNIRPWISSNFVAIAATQNGGSGWLKINSPGRGAAGQSYIGDTTLDPLLTVTANTSGLSPGTYRGTITLTGGKTLPSQVTQVISVTLVVSGGVSLQASPASLNFVVPAGGPPPATQPYTIAGPSGGVPLVVTVKASTDDGGNWLSAGNSTPTVSSGTVLNAGVTPGNLSPGLYHGSILLTAPGAAAFTIPVTMTVQSPQLTASQTALNFQYNVGDPLPPSQSVRLTGTAGAGFTAQASSTGNWLSAAPASGTIADGGSNLSVTVDPSVLSPGTYQGNIAVANDSGATAGITVTLTVTAPLPTITDVLNGASNLEGAIAPGEMITIAGTGLGPATPVAGSAGADGFLPATLAGVQVLVGGYPAPIVSASSQQVVAMVPYEIASPFLPNLSVLVRYGGQGSNGFAVTQAAAAPGIFTAQSTGSPSAVFNSDGTPNSDDHPAAKGDVVVFFLTGEGQTAPTGSSGKITILSDSPPLTPVPLLPVSVTVDGQPAVIDFAGEAPNVVAGVMQLNVHIPDSASSGDVQLVVTVGTGGDSHSTQPGVTISVK